MKKSLLFVLVGMWASAGAMAQTTDTAIPMEKPEPVGVEETQWGPQNGGLALGLVIGGEAKGDSPFRVPMKVLLKNCSDKPITLVARWDYEDENGDFAEYFKENLRLATFPEVRPSSFQTAGMDRKAPQPQHTLAPGETISVKWTARYPTLGGGGAPPRANILFPSDGLYGVRARFMATMADGRRALLFSRHEAIAVGGDLTMPKFATARVVYVDAGEKDVTLDLGTDHGIEAGDRFLIRPDLATTWEVIVEKASETRAQGTVKALSVGRVAGAMPMPERGMIAELQRPEQTAQEMGE